MTADDILALNTILEARPGIVFLDGFIASLFSVLVSLVAVTIPFLTWGCKSKSVRILGFLPLFVAFNVAFVLVSSGLENGYEEQVAWSDWRGRLERTGACARFGGAVEAGRVRWLDGITYRTFAEQCGREVAIASANAEGVDLAIGETDTPRGR